MYIVLVGICGRHFASFQTSRMGEILFSLSAQRQTFARIRGQPAQRGRVLPKKLRNPLYVLVVIVVIVVVETTTAAAHLSRAWFL